MTESDRVVDPIDALISSLQAFHIGTSWGVVGAPKTQNGPAILSGDADMEKSEDEDNSTDDNVYDQGDVLLMGSVLAGLMPTVIAVPQFIEHEIWNLAKEQDERNRQLPKRRKLANPKPGCRPCWEPPLLAYLLYEEFIIAHNTIMIKEGRKDIEWRTQLMDVGLENDLLKEYRDWIEDMHEEATMDCRKEESFFYANLLSQVIVDKKVVSNEWEKVGKMNGGIDGLRDYFFKLREEINAIRRSRGADSISWETPSSSYSLRSTSQTPHDEEAEDTNED